MARPMKTQYVTLRLVFDQPITKRRAYQHVKEQIEGHIYYTIARDDADAESFKISRVISSKAGA